MYKAEIVTGGYVFFELEEIRSIERCPQKNGIKIKSGVEIELKDKTSGIVKEGSIVECTFADMAKELELEVEKG